MTKDEKFKVKVKLVGTDATDEANIEATSEEEAREKAMKRPEVDRVISVRKVSDSAVVLDALETGVNEITFKDNKYKLFIENTLSDGKWGPFEVDAPSREEAERIAINNLLNTLSREDKKATNTASYYATKIEMVG